MPGIRLIILNKCKMQKLIRWYCKKHVKRKIKKHLVVCKEVAIYFTVYQEVGFITPFRLKRIRIGRKNVIKV